MRAPIYQLLLVVEKPDIRDPEIGEKWDHFLKSVRNASMQDRVEPALSETVLLLTLNGDLSKIGDVLSHLHGWNYRYTLLNSEIVWHEVRAGG